MELAARPRVLVVDDDVDMCELVAESIGKRFDVEWQTDPARALDLLRARPFDALVTDFRMRGMTGVELCRAALDVDPALPVILMTAFGSMESAVEAMRAGAYDYVTKPVEMQLLGFAIERAARARRLADEVKRLRAAIVPLDDASLMGRSQALTRVRELVARVAVSDAPVLLTGESGTGKELTARAIHAASPRHAGPFVAINCAAMPEALLESELFGHVKGAFTDAKSAHAGLFVQASGGTLLLDEIGDMPLSLQPKLLRALETRSVRPVGGAAEVAFDVRIVAATHRDLEEAIASGAFREDLYYRLDVVEVGLPPLRARGDDVLLLAQHFLSRFSAKSGKPVRGFGADVAEILLAYAWPGNVRELSNAMERAVALTKLEQLAVEDLPDRVRTARRTSAAPASVGTSDDLVPLEEMERRYILHAFEVLGKNRTLTAQVLEIDRKTLYRKLERWGV